MFTCNDYFNIYLLDLTQNILRDRSHNNPNGRDILAQPNASCTLLFMWPKCAHTLSASVLDFILIENKVCILFQSLVLLLLDGLASSKRKCTCSRNMVHCYSFLLLHRVSKLIAFHWIGPLSSP